MNHRHHHWNLQAAVVVVLAILGVAWSTSDARSFLWKVQGKQSTAYILGSFHAVREGTYPLAPVIEKSFAQAQSLMVEGDLTTVDMGQAQKMVQKKAQLPPGDTLCNHLSAQTCRSVEERFAGKGVPIALFSGFKPWFVGVTVALLEIQQSGYDFNNGIDLYFCRKAKGTKEIIELESMDLQFSILDSFTPQEQELFLVDSLREASDGGDKLDAMYQAWLNGDAATLEEATLGEMKQRKELEPIYEKIYFKRNRNMAAAIERKLQGKEIVFVVVGSGHLVGRQGVIELLRGKGYRVEQL